MVNRYEVVLSLFPNRQQSGIVEDLQMMGDGRLGQWKVFSDLAAGKLAAARNFTKHLETLPVCQSLQYADKGALIEDRRGFLHRCI
jgi:hypothetical protein